MSKLSTAHIASIQKDIRVFPSACQIVREDESVGLLDPTPAQQQVGDAWVKHPWIFVCKYRQAKITTYTVLCVLGMVMVSEGTQGLVIADKYDTGQVAWGRANHAYATLPPAVKLPLAGYRTDPAKKEITFAHRGAVRVLSGGVTKAGIGNSPDRVLITEYMEFPDPDDFNQHFFPAINKRPNAKVCIESTPGEWASTQHKLWQSTLEGKSRFTAVFLKWWLDDTCKPVDPSFAMADFRPTVEECRYAEELLLDTDIPDNQLLERLAFRRLSIENDFHGDELLFDHKYPRSAQDGWTFTSRPAIPPDALKALFRVAHKDVMYTGVVGLDPEPPATLCDVAIFEVPTREFGKDRYLITADPAGYGSEGDPSSIVVWDMVTCRDVAAWAGRTDPNSCAKRIAALQAYYGTKRTHICVESNKGEVLAALIAMGVSNIFYYKQDHPGIFANEKTNEEAHEALVDLLRKGDMTVRSLETLHQLGSWDGKARAKRARSREGTHHFDRAVACRLAAWMFRHSRFSGMRKKPQVPLVVNSRDNQDKVVYAGISQLTDGYMYGALASASLKKKPQQNRVLGIPVL